MMEERATEGQVMGLVSYIERVGLSLPRSTVARIFRIIDEAIDTGNYPEHGNQKEQAAWIRQRIERDGQ